MPKGLKGFQKKHKAFKGTEKTRFKKGDKRLIGNKFSIGKIPWNKNKKGYHIHSKEWKREQGEKMKGNEFNAGRKPTIEQRRKQSEALRGEKSYLWKGGLTKLRKLVRSSYKYRQWRSDVFARDDFTCQICGKRGGEIEADHSPKSYSDTIFENQIKTLEDAFVCEELWNINNGRTLCRKCHKLTDNYLIHKKH